VSAPSSSHPSTVPQLPERRDSSPRHGTTGLSRAVLCASALRHLHASISRLHVPTLFVPGGQQKLWDPVQQMLPHVFPVVQTHRPVAGTHVWPDGHVFGVSWHVPLLHVPVVHRLLSALHGVPLATNWLGGHWAEVPVQVSATSQGPAAGRHTTVAGLN